MTGSFNIYCPSSVSFTQWRPNATRSTCMILIARICNPVTQCFTLKDHRVYLHLGNSFKFAPVIWNHEADITSHLYSTILEIMILCPWSTTFPSIPHWSSIPTSRHTTVMLLTVPEVPVCASICCPVPLAISRLGRLLTSSCESSASEWEDLHSLEA